MCCISQHVGGARALWAACMVSPDGTTCLFFVYLGAPPFPLYNGAVCVIGE
jgi:hypothetical protein